MSDRTAQETWLDALEDEDLAFIKQFLLVSGSLKNLAAAYKVTYPTIRVRLNRLIDRIQILDYTKPTSPFEKTIMALYANGKLDATTMKAILIAHEPT